MNDIKGASHKKYCGYTITLDKSLISCHHSYDMYLRKVSTKYKGELHTYYQLVKSIRVGTEVKKKILMTLGKTDDSESIASYLFGGGMLLNKNAKLYALPTAIYTICIKELILQSIFADIFKDSRLRVDVFLLTVLMIIHRIVDPDSKLSLTRWYKNIMLPVSLPDALDVHSLYYTLDYLLEKKEEIEKKVYRHLLGKGFIDAAIVFYDLTSSYFEGDSVEMGEKGYSRDHRFDRPQITLGMVIDRKNGLPLYHEVFEGNMSDSKTVKGILEKLHTLFELQNIIFVADKGMLTPDNLKELEERQYQSILSESIRNALTRKQREELFLSKDTFIKKTDNLWYTQTKDEDGKDIIVCYNQYTAAKAKDTRDTKLKKLQTFIKETKEKHKEETDKKAILEIRDSILARLVTGKARKYFDSKDKKILTDLFPIKQEVITREEYMDGFWVIRSNTKDLSGEELITAYKDLKSIEASFRVIKDVIELRPIYHHKDERVKGHVFICILAFLTARLLEMKTDSTIKMLREEYISSVALPTNLNHPQDRPIILGGEKLLRAVNA